MIFFRQTKLMIIKYIVDNILINIVYLDYDNMG
jgi:hypothetical protein